MDHPDGCKRRGCALYYGAYRPRIEPDRLDRVGGVYAAHAQRRPNAERPDRAAAAEPLQTARIIAFSQTGQFLLFVGLAVYLRLSGNDALFALVFALVFAMSFLDGWTVPARNALVPRLVAQEQGLLKANSLISVSDQVVQFAGWGLSGVIVALLGPGPTLLLTAVIYGLAAALGVKGKRSPACTAADRRCA